MSDIDLDHVAIATLDLVDALDVTVGRLGGVVVHGGDGYGFRWVQVRLGTATTGMTVELLVVWEPEVNDFLARFVDRHGAGVHHITFKVPDLRATLARAEELGLHPVGVNLDNPQWREAFLQPREAHGTVIQLAQTEHEPGGMAAVIERATSTGVAEGSPRWWPAPPTRAKEAVVLTRIVIASPDRGATMQFFAGLLDGAVDRDDATATDLRWPGGGQIRIVDAPAAGVVHLEGVGDTSAPSAVDLSGATLTIDAL